MAKIEIREDLIGDRYGNLAVGPDLVYSFETQKGLPVDAGNPLLRDLSPFAMRLIVPELVGVSSGVDVNLLGRANQSTEEFETAAKSVRDLFGSATVGGVSNGGVEGALQQIVSAGQVVSSSTTTTERVVLTDANTAADIALQVERILNAPTLTLFVNPSEMTKTFGAVQQYSNRGRNGYLFERWGEAQVTLSFSGSTGVFMAAANPQNAIPGATSTDSPSGVQFASKRDSAAFQNFTALYQFYRNNGYLYDTIGGSEAHLMIGAVAIDYDQFTYVGHIESFDYSYQEASPHRIEWSMEFVVGIMYDNAETPVVVQPMVAPQPNPSYPGRPGPAFTARPDASFGGGWFETTGPSALEQASTPLSLLVP